MVSTDTSFFNIPISLPYPNSRMARRLQTLYPDSQRFTQVEASERFTQLRQLLEFMNSEIIRLLWLG